MKWLSILLQTIILWAPWGLKINSWLHETPVLLVNLLFVSAIGFSSQIILFFWGVGMRKKISWDSLRWILEVLSIGEIGESYNISCMGTLVIEILGNLYEKEIKISYSQG